MYFITTLVSYADDSYVIVKADDLENLKLEVETTTKAHSKFLKDVGISE